MQIFLSRIVPNTDVDSFLDVHYKIVIGRFFFYSTIPYLYDGKIHYAAC